MNRRRFLATAAATPLLAGADWSRFRGPNGLGVAPELPFLWDKSAAVRTQKVNLGGTGYGSPVVAGGNVFVQTSLPGDAKRAVTCFDAVTLAPKWEKTVAGGAGHTHKKSSLSNGTPAVDGDRLFQVVWDGSGLAVFAYDTAGKELWTASLGAFKSQHGAGHSPIAVNGKIVVNYDQDGASELVAFDAATGAKVWAAPRKPFRACYATPLVRDLTGGKVEVVVATTAGLAGYDPDSGKPNWEWAWKFDGMALRTVGSPILVAGLVFAVSGDGGGGRHAVAVKPGPGAKLVWEKKKDTPYVPCPVAVGDTLYWMTDTGLAMALDAATGKELWKERAVRKGVSSSPVVVGKNILAVAEDGQAITFAASPKGFEKLAEAEVGETVYASPAVADGAVYVRGGTNLFRISKK